MKIKCLNILIILCLGLVMVFGITENAKAEVLITDISTQSYESFIPYDNGLGYSIIYDTITIPQHTDDSILMCIVDSYQSGENAGKFSISGYGISTVLLSYNEKVSFMTAPPAGNYQIIYYSSWPYNVNWNRNNCFLIDGVDTEDPIAQGNTNIYPNTWTGSYSVNYIPVKEGNLLFTFTGGGQNGYFSSATSTTQNIIVNRDGGDYNDAFIFGYSFLTSSPYNLSMDTGGGSWWWANSFEINTLQAPASNDYIMPIAHYNYFENNGKFTVLVEKDQDSNWQTFFDVCDQWNSEKHYRIGLDIGEDFYFDNEISTCRGSFIYSAFNTDISDISSDSPFQDENFILEECDDTGFSENCLITEYPDWLFDIYVIPEVIYSNGFINYSGNDPLVINTSNGSGTTTIQFQYNICEQEGYTDSHFVLENLDTETLLEIATTTTACSGIESLELPYSKNFVNTLNARVDLVNASSSRQILGNSFKIMWQLTDQINTEECNMPSYNILDVCDDIPLGDSELLYNLKCGVKYAITATGQFLFYPSCDSLYSLKKSYDKFKDSFPFNTYYDLTDSINTAIDTSLSATSTANNFSIPFIRQTATSSEYYMLPVMSSTTISNTIGNNNYNTFRTTVGYIYWVVVAGLIFLIISKL